MGIIFIGGIDICIVSADLEGGGIGVVDAQLPNASDDIRVIVKMWRVRMQAPDALQRE